MSRILSVSDVKTHLPSLIVGVSQREEEIVVTRNGKPAAVLLGYEEYERLRATIDVLSDPDLRRQIEKSREFFSSGRRGLGLEVFEAGPPAATRRISPPNRRRSKG